MQNEAEFDSDDDDDSEIVSKSQLKRDSQALQDLGKRLTALPGDHLDRIPLDEALTEAIALARRIQNKRGALKRQYQFIGKLLRARDPAPIIAALDAIDNEGRESIQLHHRAEQWRDRILDGGVSAIDALIEEAPNADRQKLRQLWRNHRQMDNETRQRQQARLIYQEIKLAMIDQHHD